MAILTQKLRREILDLRQASYGLHWQYRHFIDMSTDMLIANAEQYRRAEVHQHLKTLKVLIANLVCQ